MCEPGRATVIEGDRVRVFVQHQDPCQAVRKQLVINAKDAPERLPARLAKGYMTN
jgi:hypothetical protein